MALPGVVFQLGRAWLPMMSGHRRWQGFSLVILSMACTVQVTLNATCYCARRGMVPPSPTPMWFFQKYG
jgi:hypothetical protein